jgi:chromosome segregation ATPase
MSKRPEPTWSEEEVDDLKAEIDRLTAENARLKSEQRKLVELLKKLHAASNFLGEFDWEIYRALKDLGELPPK